MEVKKIDFSEAKYQAPTGPRESVDLTEFETQLVGGADGIELSDDSTKKTIYILGIGGESDIYVEPENESQLQNVPGSEARIITGGANDLIEANYYEIVNLIGGDGEDYLYSNVTDGFIDAGKGADNVYSFVDQVKLGGGSDYFFSGGKFGNSPADYSTSPAGEFTGNNAWGEAGNDKMFGSDGADLLMGGDGKDKLYGESGNDTLNGGRGNDKITGGGGDDYIKGGLGNDKMKLGSGSDVVDLSRGKDKVIDFKVKEDSVLIDEEFFGQQLKFVDKKKGCSIVNGDDVNTFFKGVSSDLLATVVDLL